MVLAKAEEEKQRLQTLKKRQQKLYQKIVHSKKIPQEAAKMGDANGYKKNHYLQALLQKSK